jgi:hypothetical protein
MTEDEDEDEDLISGKRGMRKKKRKRWWDAMDDSTHLFMCGWVRVCPLRYVS